MKKIISCLMILVLAFSMTACATSNEAPNVTLAPTQEAGTDGNVTPTQEAETDRNVTPTQEAETDATVAPTQEAETDENVTPTQEPEADATLAPTQEPETDGNTVPTATATPIPTATTAPTLTPTTAPTSTPTPAAENESRILIAYFTWAENTYVADPSSIDVDATTSASVLLPGNAAKLAHWIHDEVGGDLFSILATEPYSSDYDECLDRAADEKAEDARPALVNHVENMDDYDIVFLGFPNWWYTVPMAIHTFLEEYDFSGKTIVPFVTHGTGGLASTIRDITAALPDSAVILDPIGVYRPEVDEAQPDIVDWLTGLELN